MHRLDITAPVGWALNTNNLLTLSVLPVPARGRVYLRDGSADTVLRAATLPRWAGGKAVLRGSQSEKPFPVKRIQRLDCLLASVSASRPSKRQSVSHGRIC